MRILRGTETESLMVILVFASLTYAFLVALTRFVESDYLSGLHVCWSIAACLLVYFLQFFA